MLSSRSVGSLLGGLLHVEGSRVAAAPVSIGLAGTTTK